MARHGLGADRFSFKVAEVFQIDANNYKTLIYEPNLPKILPFRETNLKELVEYRSIEINSVQNLKIRFQTPLRIRRKDKFGKTYLLEKINFTEFFKQCSLRLKLLSENYGTAFDYDFLNLMEKSRTAKTSADKLWRHDSVRLSTRQKNKLDLDGMLGDIEYEIEELANFLPFIIACEFLNIGSASSLGLGNYHLNS